MLMMLPKLAFWVLLERVDQNISCLKPMNLSDKFFHFEETHNIPESNWPIDCRTQVFNAGYDPSRFCSSESSILLN